MYKYDKLIFQRRLTFLCYIWGEIHLIFYAVWGLWLNDKILIRGVVNFGIKASSAAVCMGGRWNKITNFILLVISEQCIDLLFDSHFNFFLYLFLSWIDHVFFFERLKILLIFRTEGFFLTELEIFVGSFLYVSSVALEEGGYFVNHN